MFRQRAIYYAETEGGKRPFVVVSRDELNRGHYVVAVPLTSAKYKIRRELPHCVPFKAGEFGLKFDCVAQAELITFIEVADVDRDTGAIGFIDDDRWREVVRAIGVMMDSECETG